MGASIVATRTQLPMKPLRYTILQDSLHTASQTSFSLTALITISYSYHDITVYATSVMYQYDTSRCFESIMHRMWSFTFFQLRVDNAGSMFIASIIFAFPVHKTKHNLMQYCVQTTHCKESYTRKQKDPQQPVLLEPR
jgi:hypothetical protein